MNKQRNSSLELLRIICMFLIIIHHYFIHGGYDLMMYNNLSFEIIFLQVISLFGKTSCLIFAIISGYFLIEASSEKNYKRIIKLIIEMLFYSILIWFIVYIFKLTPITINDTIKSFFPMFYGNWYVRYYILLCILVPYLNKILLNLEKKVFLKLIITLLIIWSVFPTFTNAWDLSQLDFFIIMYLIGAYIKLHFNNEVKYSNKIYLVIGLLFASFFVVSTLLLDILGYFTNNNLFINNATYFSSLNSIFSVGCAIFIFIYFSNIIFNNRIINILSSSTLGIYLIHDNELIRPYIWTILSSNNKYIDFPYFHLLIKVFLVFSLCFLIDFIRKKILGEKFEKWVIREYEVFRNKFIYKIKIIKSKLESKYIVK